MFFNYLISNEIKTFVFLHNFKFVIRTFVLIRTSYIRNSYLVPYYGLKIIFFYSPKHGKRKTFILALISKLPVFSITELRKQPRGGESEHFLTGTIVTNQGFSIQSQTVFLISNLYLCVLKFLF